MNSRSGKVKLVDAVKHADFQYSSVFLRWTAVCNLCKDIECRSAPL